MIIAAYSRNTERAARAYLAKKAAEENQQNAERTAREIEQRERSLREERRKQQEATDRCNAEKKAQNEYMAVISAFREVPIHSVPRPKVRDIIKRVIDGSNYSVQDITGHSLDRSLVQLRHEAILHVFAMRPDLSLPRIGYEFGGRDHSTIYYCVKKFGFDNTPEGKSKALKFVMSKTEIHNVHSQNG